MDSDGIHLTRWGSGPTVLMVHGGAQGGPAGGADQWECQRPLAAAGWELVLPDRPGHGLSPSRGPEDLELDAVWVSEMLAEGAHLVGHSYGAAIALCAAGLRPPAVRSLTLIEAPVFSVASHRPEAISLRDQIAAAASTMSTLLGLIRTVRALGIPRELLRPRPSPCQLLRMGKAARTMRPPYMWDASGAIDQIRESGVPVLIVTGGWSPGFEAIGDELTRGLGGERLTIAAGHHFPQMAGEPPGGEFNEALKRFLSAADRAATAAG